MNKTRQFTTSSNLIVFTWNAGGVRTHLHELFSLIFLRENDIGVLLLTETHLATGVTFYIPVYTVFRKDRIGRRGGGVAVCIRSSMPARRVDFVTQLEAVGMETEIDGQSVIFLAVYIPPKVLLEKNDLQSLFSHPRTLVGGDFNCKHPAWGSKSINNNGRMLYKFITSTPGTGLWAPEDCTSIPPNNKMGDVLDFFLGYKIQKPRQIEILFQLPSDHYPVVCQWGKLAPSSTVSVRVQWDRFRALSVSLGSTTDTYLDAADVDRVAIVLDSSIQLLLKECSEKVRSSRFNRLGLSKDERELIDNKNAAKVRWTRFRRDADRRLFRRVQRSVRDMLRDRADAQWATNIEAANDAIGSF